MGPGRVFGSTNSPVRAWRISKGSSSVTGPSSLTSEAKTCRGKALSVSPFMGSIARRTTRFTCVRSTSARKTRRGTRSEEHTSELQSRLHLVCRLLLEKKKKTPQQHHDQSMK